MAGQPLVSSCLLCHLTVEYVSYLQFLSGIFFEEGGGGLFFIPVFAVVPPFRHPLAVSCPGSWHPPDVGYVLCVWLSSPAGLSHIVSGLGREEACPCHPVWGVSLARSPSRGIWGCLHPLGGHCGIETRFLFAVFVCFARL